MLSISTLDSVRSQRNPGQTANCATGTPKCLLGLTQYLWLPWALLTLPPTLNLSVQGNLPFFLFPQLLIPINLPFNDPFSLSPWLPWLSIGPLGPLFSSSHTFSISPPSHGSYALERPCPLFIQIGSEVDKQKVPSTRTHSGKQPSALARSVDQNRPALKPFPRAHETLDSSQHYK